MLLDRSAAPCDLGSGLLQATWRLLREAAGPQVEMHEGAIKGQALRWYVPVCSGWLCRLHSRC